MAGRPQGPKSPGSPGSPRSPASPGAAKPTAGTTSKLNAQPTPPIRPRVQSKTDEIDAQTGAPVPPKGLTPRAPSVVSAKELAPTQDLREMMLVAVKEAVKEAVTPLEKRISQLEGRLAMIESDVREATSADETRPNAPIPAAAKVAAPAPAAAAPQVPALPFVPPAFSPSPFSNVPVSVQPVQEKEKPAAASVPPPPPAAEKAMTPPARPMHFEDVQLSPAEFAMFDGNKRSRRMTMYFFLVLALLGGLLGAWAYVSRN